MNKLNILIVIPSHYCNNCQMLFRNWTRNYQFFNHRQPLQKNKCRILTVMNIIKITVGPLKEQWVLSSLPPFPPPQKNLACKNLNYDICILDYSFTLTVACNRGVLPERFTQCTRSSTRLTTDVLRTHLHRVRHRVWVRDYNFPAFKNYY